MNKELDRKLTRITTAETMKKIWDAFSDRDKVREIILNEVLVHLSAPEHTALAVEYILSVLDDTIRDHLRKKLLQELLPG